jgi:hypothetical protein
MGSSDREKEHPIEICHEYMIVAYDMSRCAQINFESLLLVLPVDLLHRRGWTEDVWEVRRTIHWYRLLQITRTLTILPGKVQLLVTEAAKTALRGGRRVWHTFR